MISSFRLVNYQIPACSRRFYADEGGRKLSATTRDHYLVRLTASTHKCPLDFTRIFE